jgi:saccharopine dehydrogenase-like NADP-dependent oxidoreductase
MKNILIIGAGRSATSLIDYLSTQAKLNGWTLTIGEQDAVAAKVRFPNLNVIDLTIENQEAAREVIAKSNLVISMIPASLHIHVARICADLGVHLLTASYVSEEIKSLNDAFAKKGAICLMEMGLDPGIDHMSAMKVLDRIKNEGHELTAFETFTGGLLAEDKKTNNPWEYKFTWNPRNVVMAGSGNVKFLQEGTYKYIPYHQLFKRTEVIHIPGYGYFEGYANRDSLKYLELYNLQGIKTLFRGTLRRPGFGSAWNIFVQLGATDDSYLMENVDQMTHRGFINSFLSYNPHDSVELKLAHYLNLSLESPEMYKLEFLDIFKEIPIGLSKGTPAQILEHILKKKWTLVPDDKDMIIMWHKFKFIQNGANREIQSSMVAIGDDAVHTAMSKTVGLPLGIIAKLILQEKINLKGVQIPTSPEIYPPVLAELNEMGFEFSEWDVAN